MIDCINNHNRLFNSLWSTAQLCKNINQLHNQGVVSVLLWFKPSFNFQKRKRTECPFLRWIEDSYSKTHNKLPSRSKGNKETTKAKARNAQVVFDGGMQFQDNQNGRPFVKNTQVEQRHGTVQSQVGRGNRISGAKARARAWGAELCQGGNKRLHVSINFHCIV